jgi:hypothetical protein
LITEYLVVLAFAVPALEATKASAARESRLKHHLLASFDTYDLIAHFVYDPGDIRAQDVRHRYMQSRQAVPRPQVEMIHGTGLDANDYLSRLGTRWIDLLQLQNLRAAVLVNAHSFHDWGTSFVKNPTS